MLGVFGSNPSFPFDRRSAAGYQGVEMRVMIQLLVSGMQHHQRRRVELPSATEFTTQGSPCTDKQQIVKRSAIAENQSRQLIRQGKDHLEIVHTRQHDLGRFVHPVSTFSTAALRAVPVAAGVVHVDLMLTALTAKQAAPQRPCPAQQNLRQHAFDLLTDIGTGKIPWSKLPENVYHRCAGGVFVLGTGGLAC